MSVPTTILLTTLRLCSFGSFVWLVGLAISGSISIVLAAVSSIIFVLDGSVATWLRSLPNDTEVSKVMRIFCMAGQASMLTCTVMCLPFYTGNTWVRAGFLMITSPVVAIGFCQDAREAFRMLFAMFLMVAYCESEPAFVLCLLVEDSWLVFSTWKGAQLIESTQREAAGIRTYHEHVKKILTVLLDCTVVVEHVAAGAIGGTPATRPDPAIEGSAAAWRVLEHDPVVDHFFGVPMQSTDVLAMMASEADRDRVADALHESVKLEHPVARLINNVTLRCSALAGGAAAATRIMTASAKGTGKQFIEVVVDLIVVGKGTGLNRDCGQPAAACIGVRVADSANTSVADDANFEPLACPPVSMPELEVVDSAESFLALQAVQGAGCEMDGSDSSSTTEPAAATLFRQAQSVSIVVQAESERMSIDRMTLHFPAAAKPQLLDWLGPMEAQQTVMWIERNMNTMWSDRSVKSTSHGPMRLFCGSGAFLVASDAVVERVETFRYLWGPERDKEQEEGHCSFHASGGEYNSSQGGHSDEELLSMCCVHLKGISQCFWPPWVVAHGARRRRRRRQHEQQQYGVMPVVE